MAKLREASPLQCAADKSAYAARLAAGGQGGLQSDPQPFAEAVAAIAARQAAEGATAMKALIGLPVVEKLTDAMRNGRLRKVPPRHRVEAIARGLGWKTQAAMSAELSAARLERDVSDSAFVGYLAEKGYPGFEPRALSEIVGKSTFAVSFSGQISTIHAPYPVTLPLVGPSQRMSRETVRQINGDLNGGRDPDDFFGGPNDPWAEERRHFVENVLLERDLEGEDFLFRVVSAL
jgi:hypothetical protein